MRITRVLLSKGLIFGLAVLFVGESALVPVSAHAQAGENAVFNGPSPTNTSAFIDAANFSSGGDICSQLHAVLNSTSTYIQKTNWQVIDARGIVGSSLLCSSMDSNPWAGLSASRRNWDTILLPAGTIKIYSTWTLPQYTRIIGEGPGITILQAASGFSGPMIQMGCLATTVGTTCGLSFGVSVENLTLDAQSQAIDGIDNSDAEEQSYVKHVQMINIGGTGGGTGLSLGIDAANNSKSNHSGPYSDISITETSSGSACINVAPSAQPRGLHGINCLCANSGSVCSSSNTSPGIYLDGSNVSLEDVNINGFGDGIRIGSQGSSGTVESDVMFNVTGGGNVTNLIHICGLNYGSHSACSQTSNSVVDLTLMGVTSSADNTIQDDVTDTLLPESSDPTVGMYILGESVTVGSNTGYSRFTTSPTIPTWRVGTASPPTGDCAIGTLYSRTSSSSTVPPTVWGCVHPTPPSNWSVVK